LNNFGVCYRILRNLAFFLLFQKFDLTFGIEAELFFNQNRSAEMDILHSGRFEYRAVINFWDQKYDVKENVKV
jgi:hypothetical protein